MCVSVCGLKKNLDVIYDGISAKMDNNLLFLNIWNAGFFYMKSSWLVTSAVFCFSGFVLSLARSINKYFSNLF